MFVILSVIDEEYRHNLLSMHYAVSFIQNYFYVLQGQRKCQSNSYIKDLLDCLGTQNKILSDQKNQTESWRVTTHCMALISNTNTIQRRFQNWLDDEATCEFCKQAINSNRSYSMAIETFKSQLTMNSSKIDVEFLQNLLEGLKTKVNRIKSESKCREFIIVID